MRRTPLRRKTPMRPPARPVKKSKNRRVPKPDAEFWQGQRAAIAARAGGRCERCGRDLNQTGLEAHHRKLRSQGGAHGVENLAALCPEDHRWCHEHPAAARLEGFIIPAVSDPASRAVTLHDGRTVRFTVEGGYDLVFEAEPESGEAS